MLGFRLENQNRGRVRGPERARWAATACSSGASCREEPPRSRDRPSQRADEHEALFQMSDQKLRELQRRWKETQSVEDEATYLLERVRVGDLSKAALELAAYCGHEAARLACSTAPGDESRNLVSESLRTALSTIRRVFGRPVLARACLLMFGQAHFEEGPVTKVLEAGSEWAERPSQEAARRVRDLATHVWEGTSPSGPEHAVASAIVELAHVVDADEASSDTSAYRVARLLERAGHLNLENLQSTLAHGLGSWALS